MVLKNKKKSPLNYYLISQKRCGCGGKICSTPCWEKIHLQTKRHRQWLFNLERIKIARENALGNPEKKYKFINIPTNREFRRKFYAQRRRVLLDIQISKKELDNTIQI